MKYYNEMLVHVAINTHKEPVDVLLVGENKALEQEIKRHECVTNLKVIVESEVKTQGIKSFDVIISEKFFDEFAQIVKDDGLVTVDGGSYIDDLKAHKELLKSVGEEFYIAMPFRVDTSSGVKTPILASKKYHPTADINLQRADLMDGLEYYNSDIHVASFTKPTYIYKELLGISKN